MPIVQVPTRRQILENAEAACSQRGIEELRGEGAPALSEYLQQTVGELYPLFVYASGALPAVGRRSGDSSLFLSGQSSNALPHPDEDAELRAYRTLLTDGTLNDQGTPIVQTLAQTRETVYDVLWNSFQESIAQASGGLLQ